MRFTDLSRMFNRSFKQSFNIQKCLFIFLFLILSGLVFLFFQTFVLYSPNWLKLPLLAIPIFIMSFLLMLSGTALCQEYASQGKGSLKSLFFFSKTLFFQASYFHVPLLLAVLAITLLLGILILINSIPFLGTFFAIVLAFIPFLLNLCIVLLCITALLILFFFTPLIAHKKQINRKELIARLHCDLFTHFILVVSAIFPLWIMWWLGRKAALFTFLGYAQEGIWVMQELFILIPFSTLMVLPIIFFFNFSQEAYCKAISESVSFQANESD